MRRLLAWLLPVAVTVGCTPGPEVPGPQRYELLRIEGSVAGPQGERSHRVDGDEVTIVVRDARWQVIEETTRTLSASERHEAARQVARALEVRTGLVCTDAPEYRLIVEQPPQDPREVSIGVCSSEEVAPFEELEDVLRGQG